MDMVQIVHLSDLQRRILRLAAGGATPAEIARRLNRSPRAVEHDLALLVTRLGVRDTREATLVWWASRAGARADLYEGSGIRDQGSGEIALAPTP